MPIERARGGFPARTPEGTEALRAQRYTQKRVDWHTGFIGQRGRFVTENFGRSKLLFRGLLRLLPTRLGKTSYFQGRRARP
jgi:hypothetical protein